MIFDCTTVFNEFELLFMRSGELKGPVDKWFVAEGNYDFSGNKREWRLALYKPPGHKIIRVDLSFLQRLPPQQRARASEIYQRNQLIEAVLAIAGDNDTIWISDVDDIPKPEMLKAFSESPYEFAKVTQETPSFFALNVVSFETIRNYVFKAGRLRRHMQENPNVEIRTAFDAEPCPMVYQNGMWVFSYMCSQRDLEEKLRANKAYEHDNPEHWKNVESSALRKVKRGPNFLERDYFSLVLNDICTDYPKVISNNLQKFKDNGWIFDPQQPDKAIL